MSSSGLQATSPFASSTPATTSLIERLIAAVRAAQRPILFGLRLWVSVCLAAYVSFWLELDSPTWAATTAALVCQPTLGATLRKASFRIVGTIVGAIAIVLISICFPQDRVGFLLALALWGSACVFVSTILQNYASYAAGLAGMTALIIAMYLLGPTGGIGRDVLTLAIGRATEICIGIVCAGVVLAGTDLGGARRELAAKIANLTAAITNGLAGTFLAPKSHFRGALVVRRQLIRDVAALSPMIDQAIGESSELRARTRVLPDAVGGLFTALAAWRIVAEHLYELSDELAESAAAAILHVIPDDFRCGFLDGEAARHSAADPLELRRSARETAFALVRLPAQNPSQRLLADQAANAMLGIARALNGLVFVDDPSRADLRIRMARLHVPDWLPPFINAVRAFVTIGVAQLFWIITAWPNGPVAVTFAAIPVILFSPRGDQAPALVRGRIYGVILSAIIAGVLEFAVLPRLATFEGFALALGSVLVPFGALAAQPWNAAIFFVIVVHIVPLIGIHNVMVYDAAQFFNTAMGILVGTGFAALVMWLIPPLSPAERSRRLLAITLRDLRRLADATRAVRPREWQNRIFSRLSVLPLLAELPQGAKLVAALSLGTEIIRMRRVADLLAIRQQLEPALAAVAGGESGRAVQWLAEADRALAAAPDGNPDPEILLRARARICAMTEALTLF
ncbi:MAG: FUSC family protein, partial [Xanthobacteraceae bacterium]|nr:FUSC family protein [Xanthobacteraceae bacterium]